MDKVSGTTPADIKRYLKPLLEARSDLMLVGRLLVARPVRHLLRGAYLGRTSDKYEFRIYPYAVPLYGRIDGVGYGTFLLGAAWKTWQPHFEALLANTLAEDIFDRVGSLTTLTEFADELKNAESIFDPRVHALVLGGARQRAKDYVRKTEKRLGKAWAEEQRALLKRDIHEVCAEFRAREAENVKRMKLDAAWEPSPFPAELPARQRHRVAEPPLSSEPWIATPSWLLGDVPDLPGEVRFAKSVLRRKRGIVLLVPLARDAAERRHRDCEPYVMAARDADGILVLLRYIGGRDAHDPQDQYGSRQDLIVEMFPAGFRIQAVLYQTPNDQAVLYFCSWTISRRSRRFSIWDCYVGLEGGLWTIHDSRGRGECKYSEHALTDDERDLVTCPAPGFGEFEDLVPRLRAWLVHAGYGDITRPKPSRSRT